MAEATDPTAWIVAHLAGFPAGQRKALEALRGQIAAAAPDAVDTISYSMPAFRYRGRALVSYDGFKDHCSLFPMTSALIEAHWDEFSGFANADKKGTLRFTPEHPIPTHLVELIVRERIAQIDAKLAGSRARAQ